MNVLQFLFLFLIVVIPIILLVLYAMILKELFYPKSCWNLK